MHGKAGRVDPEFDKLPNANVLLQDRVRDLETLAIFSMHGDTINQLVAVGELLLVELLLEISAMTCHLLLPFDLRWTSRTITSI